jgi:hypothetical protein
MIEKIDDNTEACNVNEQCPTFSPFDSSDSQKTGTLSHKWSILVPLQIISIEAVPSMTIRTMVDTGSTYNICSLQFYNTHVDNTNHFTTPDPFAPELLLGDGKSTVQILGRIDISLKFQSREGVSFITRHPFCIIDHAVPHGIILGHTFFQSNAGFDISYQEQCIKLCDHYIPWSSPTKCKNNVSTLTAFCNGQNANIEGRTVRVVLSKVLDSAKRPVRNQYGLITNNTQTNKTLECIEIPETCIGFTDKDGCLKIPVTNHGFQDISLGPKFAIFTPCDPLDHQYYNYNSILETFELNKINTDGSSTIIQPEKKTPLDLHSHEPCIRPDAVQTEGPVLTRRFLFLFTRTLHL